MTKMTAQDFEAEYGDECTPASWPTNQWLTAYEWFTPEWVVVCEYYKVEESYQKLTTYRDMLGNEENHLAQEFKDDPELAHRLEVTGWVAVRNRKIMSRRVHKYIMTGGAILSDEGYIAGRYIPIVPVYGNYQVIDGLERASGQVRTACDAQRLYNMQLSRLAEIAALSTVEKPIFTPQQVAGHEVRWARDNINNYPYQLLNAMTNPDGSINPVGPIGYTRSSPRAESAYGHNQRKPARAAGW
jgi:hypothetical protein